MCCQRCVTCMNRGRYCMTRSLLMTQHKPKAFTARFRILPSSFWIPGKICNKRQITEIYCMNYFQPLHRFPQIFGLVRSGQYWYICCFCTLTRDSISICRVGLTLVRERTSSISATMAWHFKMVATSVWEWGITLILPFQLDIDLFNLLMV